MKHMSVLLASVLIATTTNAEWRPTAADGSRAAQAEIDARVARWALTPDFDVSQLTIDERRRLAAHEGGITTHPPMAYDALGFTYEPIYDMPVSAFHDVLTAGSSNSYDNAGRDLLYGFNVQLLSPWHNITWPHQTTLLVDLSKDGVSRSVAVEMELREDSYYVANPPLFASRIGNAISALGQFPRMTLVRLHGFEFSARTIKDMPPLGVAVTYNVRFGDVRVDTGFQWAGRPGGIPNGGTEFLK